MRPSLQPAEAVIPLLPFMQCSAGAHDGAEESRSGLEKVRLVANGETEGDVPGFSG